jgi:hypothetical protein
VWLPALPFSHCVSVGLLSSFLSLGFSTEIRAFCSVDLEGLLGGPGEMVLRVQKTAGASYPFPGCRAKVGPEPAHLVCCSPRRKGKEYPTICYWQELFEALGLLVKTRTNGPESAERGPVPLCAL